MSDLAAFLYAQNQSAEGEKIALINAQALPELKNFNMPVICHQDFKPDVNALLDMGVGSHACFDDFSQSYDRVLIVGRKHKDEMKYMIARAAQTLAPEGVIVVAAYNNEGGNRLAGYLKELGLSAIQSVSKHKGRVVSARKSTDVDQGVLQNWIEGGSIQDILDGEYLSQPGVFGWNKIDTGSAILTAHIPADLKGRVADFGCGYGYLTRYILQNCPKVKSVAAVDADYRAVQLCRDNTAEFSDRIETHWHDLSQSLNARSDRALMNFDSIIMNPPFHIGKMTDSDLGLAFIHNAYTVLRPRGSLFMVANAHLPYEDVLSKQFFRVQKLHEGGGFKVYRADK